MYLVTGATGNIGRHVVAQLLDSGKQVRVLLRDLSKAAGWHDRVQVAIGDFEQPSSWVNAFADVEAAFLMSPAPDAEPFRQLVATAKREGSPRIVFLSSGFASDTDIQIGQWHREKEDAIREAGLPHTILRPSGFMTNAYQWIGTIKSERAVYAAMGTGKYAPIAPEDIAAVAVRELTDPRLTNEILDLTGGRLLSIPEQVEILAGALGNPLRYIDISPEMLVAALTSAGLPAVLAAAVAESHQVIRSGQFATINNTVQKLIGRHPKPFEVWAHEHASVFA